MSAIHTAAWMRLADLQPDLNVLSGQIAQAAEALERMRESQTQIMEEVAELEAFLSTHGKPLPTVRDIDGVVPAAVSDT